MADSLCCRNCRELVGKATAVRRDALWRGEGEGCAECGMGPSGGEVSVARAPCLAPPEVEVVVRIAPCAQAGCAQDKAWRR